MKCPHCLEAFFENWANVGSELEQDADGRWIVQFTKCPSCKKHLIRLQHAGEGEPWQYTLVRPKGIARSPLPPEVPDEFAEDYREACLVLSDSPKASSALSRRCLQNLLREKVGVKHSNHNNEIGQVLKKDTLPPYLAEGLDAVRAIGNFAAHPIKSKNTGVIVDVESGEAEWSLDVIEGLFGFFFIERAALQRKRVALNEKLQEAGKPILDDGADSGEAE